MATIQLRPFKKLDKQTGAVKEEKRYRALIRLQGHIVSKTFPSKTLAERWATKVEAQILEDRFVRSAVKDRRNVSDAIQRYLREVLPHKSKGMQQQKQQLDWWNEQLGSMALRNLSARHIAEQKDKLSSELIGEGDKKRFRSKSTVTRYLAALSTVLSLCVREWECLEVNPANRVKKPGNAQGRTRYLNEKELKALLETCTKAANKHLYPIVVVGISTGMRLREITGLRWEDIDFRRGCIMLRTSKNGSGRNVPLQHRALELLKQHYEDRDPKTTYVFPGRVKRRTKANAAGEEPLMDYQPFDITRSWRKAVTDAALEDFRFHDLRHTCASYLAMNGASLAEIAEVLGHRTLSMVKRYSHLSESHTSSVVRSMNEKVFV